MDFIDSQESAKMREIPELTEQAGMTLRLARVKAAVAVLAFAVMAVGVTILTRTAPEDLMPS